MTTKTAVKPKEQEQPKNEALVLKKDITDQVMNKIKILESQGGLDMIKNYSVGNALKAAWLKIQQTEDRNGKPALQVCTRESIANALLDMIIQGLTPAKNQCYFIVYGSQLSLQRSYFGTVAVTKRLKGVQDAYARVIYQDDNFEYHFDDETNQIVIDKHEQKFSNIDINKIAGSYAVVVKEDGSLDISEPMTFAQIKQAWGQGATKGNSPAHKNFPEEMAKKTVLDRKCKMYFNTSDDSELLIEAVNRTTESEYLNDANYEEVVEDEIEEKANKEMLDVHVDNDNGKEEKEEAPEEPEHEIDWENPMSIIKGLKEIKDTKGINDFKKRYNKVRSTFSEKDVTPIDKALADKEDEVLRGF